MQTKHAAVLVSLFLSFIILLTGVQMSANATYQIPHVEEHTEFIMPMRRVEYRQLAKQDRRQIDCLAKNMYYEAAFEPRAGWVAVANVTMNRLLSGNYADSICGVVYQNNGSTYQFSWVGMKNRLSNINEEVYNEILKVATSVYLGYNPSNDLTKGATYYHADYVNPHWKGLEKTKKIGAHIFYRSPKDVL